MSLSKVMEALEAAQAGLEWYRDRCPEAVDGSDDEATTLIDDAIAILREHMGEQGRPSDHLACAGPSEPFTAPPLAVHAKMGKGAGAFFTKFTDEGRALPPGQYLAHLTPAPPVDQAPTQGDSHV